MTLWNFNWKHIIIYFFFFSGPIVSLKHHKSEVETIKQDTECGLSISDNEIKFERGDVIICYRNYTAEQTLDWTPGF